MMFPLLFAAAAAVGSIDPSGFNDSRHHWRNIKQPERVMQANPAQPSYTAEQVREIAANILLFQRANGGWPKDYDMLAVLTEEQRKLIRDTRGASDTSFDNHNTFTQVDYLARAYARHGEAAWREAAVRGLDFMLAAQYENGGFPQRWPKPSGIGAHITFNDGVMMGIMNVLHDAATGAPHFAWIDAARRERARAAVAKGLACLLRMQVTTQGKRSGWGQQHDRQTLAPAPARTFEPACVSPAETAEVVRFLMRVEAPTPEIVAAVDAAVAWLKRVRLDGIRTQRIPAPPVEYERHKTDFDVVIVQDEKAPPILPRMVEIGTDRALFASRSGVVAYSLAEIDRERRTGSAWFTPWPQRVIDKDYPAWRARVKF
jgi:PelA/Pel-15E family pectate lyase